MRYTVNLTHTEISAKTSFSSGQFGFCVSAENMEIAIEKVVERSKKDGFFEAGWSALITRLNVRGGMDTGSDFFEIFSDERQSIIALKGV